MKSRLGFVSNSSTSSYLIICTKEDHEKAIETLHPYYKAWVKSFCGKSQKFLGQDVIVTNMEISTEDDQPLEDYDGEMPPEAEKYWGDIWDDEKEEWIRDHNVQWVSSDTSINQYEKALKKVTKDVIIDHGYH